MALLGLLVFASESSHARDFYRCLAPKPTDISVKPISQPVRTDASKSLAQLANKEVDTINPYGFGGQSITQGIMQGNIRMQAKVSISNRYIPTFDAFCVWYDAIEVTLTIQPTIFIATEVYRDRCMRDAVMEHEMIHVRVDREIVNKASQDIGRKLYTELSKRGFVGGPIPEDQVQSVYDRMQRTVEQLVEHEQKKMSLARADAQAAVDTLEEYQRVQAICAGRKSKQLLNAERAILGW